MRRQKSVFGSFSLVGFIVFHWFVSSVRFARVAEPRKLGLSHKSRFQFHVSS
jgi:hypothetical protein